MSKKPILTAEEPASLINMDPCCAARSIADAVSQATDEYDFLSEKVSVQFYNIEQPGNGAHFVYGSVSCPTKIDLEHGEISELTRGEIRYIESRQTPIYEYQKDMGNVQRGKKAKVTKHLIGWKPRFQCREVRVAKRSSIAV